MAALTWRNVEAPRLDLRDLAISSQGMTSGLDKLATMFTAREAKARDTATDGAIAGILGVQDPNQMGAALAALSANTDPRVNQRAALEAANAHRAGLIQTGVANENLQNIQAQAATGADRAALIAAAEAGDPEAQALYRAKLEQDPNWGRVAVGTQEAVGQAGHRQFGRQMETDEFGYQKERDVVGDQQWGQEFNAQRADAAARNALGWANLNDSKNTRAQAERKEREAVQAGDYLIRKHNGNIEAIQTDPEFTQFGSKAQRDLIIDVATSQKVALEADLPESRRALNPYTDRISTLTGQLKAREAGVRDTVFSTAGARALERVDGTRQRDKEGNLLPQEQPKADELRENVARVSGFFQSPDSFIEQKRTEGFSDADINAAADAVIGSRWWGSDPGVDGIDTVLTEMRDLRKEGGYDALERKFSTASQPYRSALNSISGGEVSLRRRTNDTGKTPASSIERLEAALQDAALALEPEEDDPPAPVAPGSGPAGSPASPSAPWSMGNSGPYNVNPESDPYLSPANQLRAIQRLEEKERKGTITPQERQRLAAARSAQR